MESPQQKPLMNFTKLWIPVLALVAAILSITKDHPTLASWLFALTIVSLTYEFVPLRVARLRTFLNQRFDNRLVKDRWPEMCALVDRFGAFVDYARVDTIHGIAGGSNPNAAELAAVFRTQCPIPLEVLQGIWIHTRKQCEDPCSDFKVMYRASDALSWLLFTYNNYVVQVLFNRACREVRPVANEEIRSALNSCRERYYKLIDDYTHLVESINSRARRSYLPTTVFPRAGPL